MSEELLPSLAGARGTPRWEQDGAEDYIHPSEPAVLIELPNTPENPEAEDLLIERQLVAGKAHEFYFVYANIAHVVEVDELEPLAEKYEKAAARIRALAETDEVQNARRIRNG